MHRLLFALLLLGGCARGGGLGSNQPGLTVADAALRSGSPQVALQVAAGVLAGQPDNPKALEIQGEAQTMLGRLDEAADSFSHALKRDGSSVRAIVGLGRLKLATDPSAAETLFLQALQRDPRDTTALNDLGIARDLQGRHTDGQTAYRQALAITPELTAAQVNLALSLAMTGQGDNALRIMRPLAITPGASRKLRHDYAAVLAMAGDRAEAERILSADLSPDEVQQAMTAYGGGARPAVAATMLTDPVSPVGVQVQLAAAPSESAAQAEWRRLQERLPEAMSGYQPLISRMERDGQVFWRLRTAGFSDATEARAFCGRIRAANSGCMVVGL